MLYIWVPHVNLWITEKRVHATKYIFRFRVVKQSKTHFTVIVDAHTPGITHKISIENAYSEKADALAAADREAQQIMLVAEKALDLLRAPAEIDDPFA